MGEKQKTTNEANTVHPCFYQTMEFHEMLPDDLRFAAEIRVEVRLWLQIRVRGEEREI